MQGGRETAGEPIVVEDGIVGREEEVARIESFVASAGPAALVIEGEAGIGKTTVWRHGVALLEAAGMRVLRTTPAASESALPLSALTDLFEADYGLVRTDLPAPQRKALDVALALAEPSDPSAQDARVLHAATLSYLRELVRTGPVALAVDDCQWVDPESAAAVTYALRRIDDESILCLFSFRTEVEPALEVSQFGDLLLERISVGPLSLGATQRVLLDELGVTYPRPLVRRLVDTSGGNPFYALELARALERGDKVRPDEPPALTQTLDVLVADRLDGTSEAARGLLGALSLAPSATLRLLEALGSLDALDECVVAGLVEVDESSVRFTHPLLAAGAHARLGPEERRSHHAALAVALEDPVERGRHLARSTIGPSAEVADELGGVAAIAAGRGLPATAAEIAEDAIRLTPPADAGSTRDRRLLAARFHIQAGAFERGGELLDDVIPLLVAGNERADALRLRARATSDIDAEWDLLRQALAETDEPSIAAEVNALAVRNRLYVGDLGSALHAARAADEQARQTGDRRRIAAATTTRGLMEIWGTGAPDPEVYERARMLAESGEELPSDAYSNPQTLLGAHGLYRYELDEARRWYPLALSAAERAGDIDSSETFLWGLAQLEVRAGRYAVAGEYVERLRESTLTYDRHSLSLRWIEGVLATHQGRVDDARSALDETIAQAEERGNWFFVVYGRAALGFLELSMRDPQAAVNALDPVLTAPVVVGGDPGQTGLLPIAAEALIALGATDRAHPLVAHLEERADELAHPWSRGAADRCRGLLLADEREFDGAFDAFARSLASFDLVIAPLDRARTLLALGATQRRVRQRRAARESLEAAAAAFEELGAPLWVEHARAEASRIGGRAPRSGDLTANERRIAELVGAGMTNKEVAAALFVSDRTVESALTQIYRKLDVRSRTELARRLGSDA